MFCFSPYPSKAYTMQHFVSTAQYIYSDVLSPTDSHFLLESSIFIKKKCNNKTWRPIAIKFQKIKAKPRTFHREKKLTRAIYAASLAHKRH